MLMSGKEAKMGDFMKQKWPCILICRVKITRIACDVYIFRIFFERLFLEKKFAVRPV